MKKIILFIIYIYQKFISPITPSTCRFYPSCSNYTKEAFEKFKFLKASYLSIKRILRCHPFNKGGYDPIPTEKEGGNE